MRLNRLTSAQLQVCAAHEFCCAVCYGIGCRSNTVMVLCSTLTDGSFVMPNQAAMVDAE